jgi:hypothetical protein|tara:strand:+ start:377 stop:604 length:228 start_codon:yes stop_codon:yes gene_type:complete
MINFDDLYPKPTRSYEVRPHRDHVINIRTTKKMEKLFKQLQFNPNDTNAKKLTSGQLFEAMVFHYNESMMSHFKS